jgi:hypothetical protein
MKASFELFFSKDHRKHLPEDPEVDNPQVYSEEDRHSGSAEDMMVPVEGKLHPVEGMVRVLAGWADMMVWGPLAGGQWRQGSGHLHYLDLVHLGVGISYLGLLPYPSQLSLGQLSVHHRPKTRNEFMRSLR